jgi:hypothetical protein
MLTPALKTEVQLWNMVNTSLKKAEDRVLEAALAYKEIRTRFETGEFGEGLGWQDYVTKNSKHSFRRMRELLQIANDPDPVRKLEEMRARSLRGMTELKDKKVGRRKFTPLPTTPPIPCRTGLCDPVLTKDLSVNEALDAVYDFVVMRGWTDKQLALFVQAVTKLHERAKGSVQWHEARQKLKLNLKEG